MDIALDIETSSLSPEQGEIILLSACELPGAEQAGRVFHQLLRPTSPVLPIVTELTGLSNDELMGAERFENVVDEFLTFLGDSRIVAPNVEFDAGFLNEALRRAGRSSLPSERFHDLLEDFPVSYRSRGSGGIRDFINDNALSNTTMAVPPDASHDLANLVVSYWATRAKS